MGINNEFHRVVLLLIVGQGCSPVGRGRNVSVHWPPLTIGYWPPQKLRFKNVWEIPIEEILQNNGKQTQKFIHWFQFPGRIVSQGVFLDIYILITAHMRATPPQVLVVAFRCHRSWCVFYFTPVWDWFVFIYLRESGSDFMLRNWNRKWKEIKLCYSHAEAKKLHAGWLYS